MIERVVYMLHTMGCKDCDGSGVIEIKHSNGSLGYTICQCARSRECDEDQDEPTAFEPPQELRLECWS